VNIEEVLRVRPMKMHTVEGIPSGVFPFTTDVPLLDRWGTPLLFGPGSFLLAHTDEEHVEVAELEGAIDTYVSLARKLIAEG
jgi:acetylornithine deacetylase